MLFSQFLLLFIAIVLIAMFALVIGKKMLSSKIDEQGKRQRNAMYRFRLFQQAYENSELKKFLPELAHECISLLFSSGKFHNIGNLSAQDIEKICIEHCRNLKEWNPPSSQNLNFRKSKNWSALEKKLIPESHHLVLVYLTQQYAKGNIGKEGKVFLLKFLKKYKAKAYNELLLKDTLSKEELSRIYSNEFLKEISTYSELAQYNQAIDYLLEGYLEKSLPSHGKNLVERFLTENNLHVYQKLVDKLPKIDRRYLEQVYSESFFARVTKLEEINKYPHAFDFLLQSYLEKKTSSVINSLMEELMRKHSDFVYPKMFALLFQGNTKDFALQMIQDHDHLPTKSKITLLQFKKEDRYVQASIKKLQEQSEDNQWSPLFESISRVLGSRMKVPENTQDLRKIKKLLEFHRDNANSAGNMIKVLDIEKILENIDNFNESLSLP